MASVFTLKWQVVSVLLYFFYIDDFFYFCPNLDLMNGVKNFLSSKFDMKNLGEAEVILGIKLTRSISSITESYGYLDCKLVVTSFDHNAHLKKNKGKLVDQDLYA